MNPNSSAMLELVFVHTGQEVAEHRMCFQRRADQRTQLDFDETYEGSDTQHVRRQVKSCNLSVVF